MNDIINAQQSLIKTKHLRDIRLLTLAEKCKRDEWISIIEKACQDPEYIKERNKLIPQAVQIADREGGKHWDRIFCETMDKLWMEYGKRPAKK